MDHNPYENEWEETYNEWFHDKYSNDPKFADAYNKKIEEYAAEEKIDYDYYEDRLDTETMIYLHDDRDERMAFMGTLIDILHWEMTTDCPEAELVV